MNKVLIALDYDPTAQIVAEAGFLLAKLFSPKSADKPRPNPRFFSII